MMTEAPIPDFFGFTIFCDDIRFERDGKTSYIGSYNGQMFVHSNFPLTLPKFGFGITFVQSAELFERKLIVKIFLPGDTDEPSLHSDLTVPENAPILGIDSPKVIITRSDVLAAGLVIKSPGDIRVRVERQGILHQLGRLNIQAVQMPPSPDKKKAS
jgi:hypothetical protein